MPKNAPKKEAKAAPKHSGEALTCLILVLFMRIEIFSVSVITVRALRGDRPNDGPPPVETPDDPPSVPAITMGDEVNSQFAILINVDTGHVIAAKDPDTRFSPASMTKVMTLLVACERLTIEDLERRVPFTQEIVDCTTKGKYAGTSTSLPLESNGYTCIGDEYTIKDLLYGVGVASASDCTYMVATAVAGSEDAFVELMNQKASEMGLTDTHFDNAVGIDSANNYTTAREMAKIMSYAMQYELIVDILKVRSGDFYIKAYYEMNGEMDEYKVKLDISLSSRLEKYPTFNPTTAKLTATKTGYTDQSFMVAAAEGLESGTRYVLVLGNETSSATTVTEKFRNTMIDIELILNTYAK